MLDLLLHALFMYAQPAQARCDVRVAVSLATPLTSIDQPQKVYATVDNPCEEDIEGTATFFIQGVQVKQKPFSVRSGGRSTDAWMTWAPTTMGNQEIRIDAEGVSDPSRNSTYASVSKTIYVDRDTDHDGIPDSIDTDDDNDGLTDDQERAMGTDPLQPDTDHDGVDDKHDAYPLDPSRSRVVVVAPAPPVTPAPVPAPAPRPPTPAPNVATKPPVTKTTIVTTKPVASRTPPVIVSQEEVVPLPAITATTTIATTTLRQEQAPTSTQETNVPSSTVITTPIAPPPTESNSSLHILLTLALITGIAGAAFFTLSVKS